MEEEKKKRGRPRKTPAPAPITGDDTDAIIQAKEAKRPRNGTPRRNGGSGLTSDYERAETLTRLPDNPDTSEWRERKKRNNMAPVRRADRAGTVVTQEDMDFLSMQLGACLHAYIQPECHSDEEIEERIMTFFQWCQKQAHLPTLEELALYCGLTSGQFNAIIKGQKKPFSERTPWILERAKEILKALDAALAEKSQINTVAYIFRAKNFYDMVDKVEHVVATEEPEEHIDIADIQARYALDDSVIDSDYSEVDSVEQS